MKNFITTIGWLIVLLSFVAAVVAFFEVRDIWVSLGWLGVSILGTVAAIGLGSVEDVDER